MDRAEVLYVVDMLRNNVAFPDSSPALAGRQRLLRAESATSCCCVYGHQFDAAKCFESAGLLPMGVSNCCPELMWGDLGGLKPYYTYVY